MEPHWILVVCGRCYSHTMNWLMLLPKWQMELPHMNGLMLLPNVVDGTATYVTADSLFIVADGIATL